MNGGWRPVERWMIAVVEENGEVCRASAQRRRAGRGVDGRVEYGIADGIKGGHNYVIILYFTFIPSK